MVTFVCYGRGDARTLDLYDFYNGTQKYSNKKSNTFTIDYIFGGTKHKTVIEGSGFVYAAEGYPYYGAAYQGTATKATNYVSGKLYATIDGISIAQRKAAEYISWHDPLRVNKDVFKGNDKITGSVYDDYLDGWGGSDTLSGGKGNDTFIVSQVGDRVIEKAGEGTKDLVLASVTHTLSANVENLTLTGSGKINGAGNSLANALTGNGADNVLDGKAGNDLLKGGAGSDTFTFSTALGATNVDHIVDFSTRDDSIALSDAIFKALTADPKTHVLTANEFKVVTTGTKLDADDHILYDKSTGKLFYDADGSGSVKAVLFAVVDNHAALTYKDFLLV